MAGLLAVQMTASCSDFDPADRRLARQDEYALHNQHCTLSEGRLVATGDLVNHSGRSVGFAVIVRFLDGDVDLGGPQTVTHVRPLDGGETWRWEVGLPLNSTPAEPRCNVIQVALGNNVAPR